MEKSRGKLLGSYFFVVVIHYNYSESRQASRLCLQYVLYAYQSDDQLICNKQKRYCLVDNIARTLFQYKYSLIYSVQTFRNISKSIIFAGTLHCKFSGR